MMWEHDYPEIAKIKGQQGWEQETLLGLVLGWADKEGHVDALHAHLEIVQDEENQAHAALGED